MRESEIPGLIELKVEYEGKLAQIQDYQQLRQEFQKNAMILIREAVKAKGIGAGHLEPVGTDFAAKPKPGDCGFCTFCITSCTNCVFHISG